MEYEVVPLGDDISQRAAMVRLAEGNTAFHAPKNNDFVSDRIPLIGRLRFHYDNDNEYEKDI